MAVHARRDAQLGVWGYAGLEECIVALFDGPVDVVDRDALKRRVAPAATADAIYRLLTRPPCVAGSTTFTIISSLP